MGSDGPHSGVRYTVDVGPGDAGMRISLRRRLPDGKFGDVLGVLERWADGTVAVRRRDDTLVEVLAVDVVAAKRVPPAPVRRSGSPPPDGPAPRRTPGVR